MSKWTRESLIGAASLAVAVITLIATGIFDWSSGEQTSSPALTVPIPAVSYGTAAATPSAHGAADSSVAAVRPASSPTPRTSPAHDGNLVINFEMCCAADKIGKDTWRSGSTVTADVRIFDATGELRSGCYVKFTLLKDGATSSIVNGGCGKSFAWAFAAENLSSGTYELQADVTTDWDQQGTARRTFMVS